MVEDVHARVRLSGHLFRESLRALAGELARRGEPPVRPEEKMALHRRAEHAAWEMPASALRGADVEEEWEETTAPSLPEVQAYVAGAVREALAARGLAA